VAIRGRKTDHARRRATWLTGHSLMLRVLISSHSDDFVHQSRHCHIFRLPVAFSGEVFLEDIRADVDTIDDLEIIHSDADEIRAALKREAESVLRQERSGGLGLERDPRFRACPHKLLHFFRAAAKDIVVILSAGDERRRRLISAVTGIVSLPLFQNPFFLENISTVVERAIKLWSSYPLPGSNKHHRILFFGKEACFRNIFHCQPLKQNYNRRNGTAFATVILKPVENSGSGTRQALHRRAFARGRRLPSIPAAAYCPGHIVAAGKNAQRFHGCRLRRNAKVL